MPNGGQPRQMRLRPRRSEGYVVHAEEMRVRIFVASEWDASGPAGRPMVDFEDDEAVALAWFVTRWAEERGRDPSHASLRDVDYD